MHCPFCQSQETKVIDTRVSEDGYSIRRRRECIVCSKRFTTQESMVLMVVKRGGNAEPFNREKVVSGVRKACKGRPIDEEELKLLGIRVERDLRSRGVSEVKAEEVGLAILEPLRQLDEVAYMRFASVYQHFNSLDDYSQAIDSLKKARSQE
ncbi:transcriptional regulator NrdR [Alloscardovia omnicolens]|nr:transcriptional regulator NrdR [Alloscardovia omnicolens]MDK6249138.1 transcriptional regulator NrdR [Alloscardovia omnicolens]MDK6250708.1 transcriptional regulator NrdR [Alloscardovia omnicolens]MDK6327696.1 transcriptional regulator NrdR [Alloscardovia omnicolens]MDK6444631.1 transcriptional regulator NrdR [Alloscardovia omnicolens]MDK6521676.1 transcriptional regulator NrdR [Alloscardovia omnicolens]